MDDIWHERMRDFAKDGEHEILFEIVREAGLHSTIVALVCTFCIAFGVAIVKVVRRRKANNRGGDWTIELGHFVE